MMEFMRGRSSRPVDQVKTLRRLGKNPPEAWIVLSLLRSWAVQEEASGWEESQSRDWEMAEWRMIVSEFKRRRYSPFEREMAWLLALPKPGLSLFSIRVMFFNFFFWMKALMSLTEESLELLSTMIISVGVLRCSFGLSLELGFEGVW